ncbi:hypothetical protein KL918_003166 [Ogataea parapolymorpha]|nr:hypothetical protein KL918_003166 [Ogataea parapolymorpha]KAG7872335.1 hypothetical protein KL916_003070 [Ogataea parapolymorpha]
MLESSIQPQVACRRVSRADGNSGRPPRHNTSQVCHNAASRRSFVPPLGQPTVHNTPRKSRSLRETVRLTTRERGKVAVYGVRWWAEWFETQPQLGGVSTFSRNFRRQNLKILAVRLASYKTEQ